MGRNGASISMTAAESSGYAMAPLQVRRMLFIHLRTQGLFLVLSQSLFLPYSLTFKSSRPRHGHRRILKSSRLLRLYVNPCLKKQLTNI
ncbi:uncharacterized protein LACBIDRAFT_316281 [Laccaria bicolor S238N-H82]|uniref:Predicted protein n=1 Tax=Laccaria bicolor (strain S238N-H82 / ATCC MYA-4686) TaxID=486041 RepID=B0E0L8_LACBS|nr:uncharacterized protein LACBIDRAFT_316281 [Laccaria bicolor S238N-H82]EDQ99609.1 predicted protein [Laccaria bicolor S238N-H82]|eukprot:XP_001889720.1 predicted protein [Laccaria bicolor S238N-H82]